MQLVPDNGTTPSATGYHPFSMEVEFTDANGNAQPYTEVIQGEIKDLNLQSCIGNAYPAIAYPSQLSSDLESLFNLLINPGSTNHFISTTATNLGATPYENTFQSSLEPLLDPANSISDPFTWAASANNLVYDIKSSGTNTFIRIQFCAAPTGTNFTSSNTFADVSYFNNMLPLGPNDVPSCSLIDGKAPNFKIDAHYAGFSGGSVTQENRNPLWFV